MYDKRTKLHHLLLPWLIWGLAAAYYFSDYMARVAPGVMHQQLQTTFSMSEVSFGLITYAFYIPYILMQMPVGLLVDRISIRRLLTLMSLITALGCLVFGMAPSLWWASLGRMLIGFSAAFAFISSLRLATAWFPPKKLGLLAGLTQALGMLGAASGEAPIAYLVRHYGWRESMFCLAVLFVILAVFLYRYIHDHPEMAQTKLAKNHRHGILDCLLIVLKHRQTWINALYAGCLFAPTAVIGESYGPAFLQYGWGLSAHQAATAIGFIFIGWGIGGPLVGMWSDRIAKRKPLMFASAFFTLLLTAVMVYFPISTPFWAYGLFFTYGLVNTGVGLAYAVSTEILPSSVIGASIAFTNMASIFVGASLQPMVGRGIDAIAGSRSFNVANLTLGDFQGPLSLIVICAGLAVVLSLLIKETHAHKVMD